MPVEPWRTPLDDITGSQAPRRQRIFHRWLHVILRLLGIIICLEVGTLLVVFPWVDYWDQNYFSGLSTQWNAVWTNHYFRGAVSGLGLLNLYISVAELLRLLRPGRC